MTSGMRRNGLLWGLAAAVLLVIAYAWIDGGLRPIREIAETLPVPGASQ